MEIVAILPHLPLAVAMIFTGAVAGFIAGLLGVGGGIVVVPVLDLVLAAFEVDPSVRMKVAVATSLACIIFTSMSSARSHWLRGAVESDLLASWAPALFVGVVFGTMFSSMVDGRVLTIIFAVTALLIAANMILRADNHRLSDGFPNPASKFGSGLVIGAVSAMMGIGGGTLSVPIQTAVGVDIRRAVATASVIGLVIAVPATIGFVIGGWNAADRPPYSLGFVNLLALAAIVPFSMLTTPFGAELAHTIPRKYLAYGFGIFLLLTSVRMFMSFFGA